MNHGSRATILGVVALLAAVTLSLGLILQPLAVDDAFITYRYAQNLAAGHGFVYNPGQPVLSTTAPLYALILAAAAWLGLDLPSFASALSAVALWAGAMWLFVLGRREATPWVGALAALLYGLYPLLWLSLGLETAVFLALALGAVATYRGGRLNIAAVLLALATLARADGLVLTAVLAIDYLWRALLAARHDPGRARSHRQELAAAGVYAAVLLPFVAWLVWQFGSPLPATLGAKQAQAVLGVTGFYPHTTYLEGLGILARARLAQSPLYVLFFPAVLAGLAAMGRRGRWVALLTAWSAAHLLGYALLGVTPYYWYYAPLVPGLVSMTALGIVASVRWLEGRDVARWVSRGLGGLWAAGLVVALVGSDLAMTRALDGPVPPPEDPVSKVLPEAKAGPYRLAGRWLHEHTPAGSLVGVTEVGIMGYYAERPMVDFLGLLEPDVSAALARGDLTWGLLRYQPDYLALTGITPLYAYDLRADPWFQVVYAPVQRFEDPRFWGSPVTIYERQVPRMALAEPAGGYLPAEALRLDADFGGEIRLLGALVGDDLVQPGDVLAITLYWQATGPVARDYTAFVHLLGQHERVIAQRDAPPGLGARPTSQWMPGQTLVDPYLVALPGAAFTPDEAVWEVGLYEAATGQRLQLAAGGDNVRFGAVSVRAGDEPLHLDFGPAALTGYELERLALAPGEALTVRLSWAGEGPAQVTVQLVGERGEIGAQAVGDLAQEVYQLFLGDGVLPGAYNLEVLVADPATGETLPLLGADGQPRGDRARLTKVRVYP